MSTTVRIPSPLRQYTELQSEVELEGKTVREVLESFKVRFPDAATRFFSANTSRYMNLYLNDQDIRSLNDLDTPVGEKDILSNSYLLGGLNKTIHRYVGIVANGDVTVLTTDNAISSYNYIIA